MCVVEEVHNKSHSCGGRWRCSCSGGSDSGGRTSEDTWFSGQEAAGKGNSEGESPLWRSKAWDDLGDGRSHEAIIPKIISLVSAIFEDKFFCKLGEM